METYFNTTSSQKNERDIDRNQQILFHFKIEHSGNIKKQADDEKSGE